VPTTLAGLAVVERIGAFRIVLGKHTEVNAVVTIVIQAI
jgi:hypothetical protein